MSKIQHSRLATPYALATYELASGTLSEGIFGSRVNNAFYSASGNLADVGWALNSAEEAGMTTIDSTRIGRFINTLAPDCWTCWNMASQGFAANTAGSATAYIGFGANLNSVFFSTELLASF